MSPDSLQDFKDAELVTINPFTGESIHLGRFVSEIDDLEIGRKVVTFKKTPYIPVVDDVLTVFRNILSEAFSREERVIIDREEDFKSHALVNFRLLFIDSMGVQHRIIPVDVSRIIKMEGGVPPYMIFGAMKYTILEKSDILNKVAILNQRLIEANKEVPKLKIRGELVNQLEMELSRSKQQEEYYKTQFNRVKAENDEMKIIFSDILYEIEIAKSDGGLEKLQSETKAKAESLQLARGYIKGVEAELSANIDYIRASASAKEKQGKSEDIKKMSEKLDRVLGEKGKE